MKDSNLAKGSILKGSDYNYRIECVLGQGSFGITYLATTKVKVGGKLGNIETEVKVAVKEFFMKEFSGRREDGSVTEMTDGSLVQNYSRKFRKEAENLATLSHPGIVNVLEVFDANNTCYYAMQYIAGGSLDSYIKSCGGLPEDEAVECIRQIGEAVQYMHDHKMLHLDLKPGNVMRSEDGKKMVLIDFGLSKQYTDDGNPESSTTVGLGTPGYAPIEQSNADRDRDFAPTLDVYALGATFFKLLTGETPPKASDVLNEGLPTEKLRGKGVSQKNIDAIEKAMEPRKGKRVKTVEEFFSCLDGIVKNDDCRKTEESSFKPETPHVFNSQYGILMFDVGYDNIKVAVLTQDGYSIVCSEKLGNVLDGFYDHPECASGKYMSIFSRLFTNLKRSCEVASSSVFESCTAVCPSDYMLPHILILKEAFSRAGMKCYRVIDRCDSIANAECFYMQNFQSDIRFLVVDRCIEGRAVVKEYGYGNGVLESGFGSSVFLNRIKDNSTLINELYFHKVFQERHRFDKTICTGMTSPLLGVPEFGKIELSGNDYFRGLYIQTCPICKSLDGYICLRAITDEMLLIGADSSLLAFPADTTIPIKEHFKQQDGSRKISMLVQRRKLFDASHNMSCKSFVVAHIPEWSASDIEIDIDANSKISINNHKTTIRVDYRSFLESRTLKEYDSDESTSAI